MALGNPPPSPCSRHETPAALWWLQAVCRLDARSLALFRIAAGTLLAADALLRTRDFRIMFGADGLFPPGVLRAYQADPCIWSACFLLDAEWWQAVVLATEGLAGVALALGFHTRIATIVAWAAAVSVLRRTMPAANAGDVWLVTLLFWGIFLPLGEAWSLDSRAGRPAPSARWWMAIPFVLQILVVYFTSGLAKLGGSWLSGDAVSHALSVHDHGTPLGEWVASFGWPTRLLTWGVISLELVGPMLIVAVPIPSVRLAVVVAFMAFHGAVAGLMSVGLFAPIGMAAWSALLPAAFWGRLGFKAIAEGGKAVGRPNRVACAVQAVCGSMAVVALVHGIGPWEDRPMPGPAALVVNLACLPQDWRMFGDVPRQRQWVYGRAELADGRLVDPLRGGRAVEQSLPSGGYFSLPHHRWHKVFWELPQPRMRVFSAPIARSIVGAWNGSHPPSERIIAFEIRAARRPTPADGSTEHEILLAAWPERDDRGQGNLERFLESEAR